MFSRRIAPLFLTNELLSEWKCEIYASINALYALFADHLPFLFEVPRGFFRLRHRSSFQHTFNGVSLFLGNTTILGKSGRAWHILGKTRYNGTTYIITAPVQKQTIET